MFLTYIDRNNCEQMMEVKRMTFMKQSGEALIIDQKGESKLIDIHRILTIVDSNSGNVSKKKPIKPTNSSIRPRITN